MFEKRYFNRLFMTLESRDSERVKIGRFWTILSSFFRDPLMGGSYIATVFAVPMGFPQASHYGGHPKTAQKHPFFAIFEGLETVSFCRFQGFQELYFSQERRFYPQLGRRVKLHRWSESRKVNLLGRLSILDITDVSHQQVKRLRRGKLDTNNDTHFNNKRITTPLVENPCRYSARGNPEK